MREEGYCAEIRIGDLVVTTTFNATNKVTKKGRRQSSADADLSCNPLGHQCINPENTRARAASVQALIEALIARIRVKCQKSSCGTGTTVTSNSELLTALDMLSP